MIINQYLFLDPVFNGVTAAWPLSESTNKMRREVLGSGQDFFPQNVTQVSNQTKFSGGLNSYMAAPAPNLSLNTDEAFTWCFTIKPSSLPAGTFDVLCKGAGVFGADAEYRIYLSGATLNFRLYFSTSSAVTVSANITNGVDNIIFLVHDPVNDVITIKVNNAAPVSVAHSGGCRSKYGSLMMGNTTGNPFLTNITPPPDPQLPGINTTSINSAISNVIFWKGRALTSADQTKVRTILLSSGFPWAALSEVDYTLDPDTLDDQYKAQRYDFTDLTGQFQDISKTLPVVNNNDPVRVIVSKWGTGEEATAPNDASRPLIKTATLNGNPTVYTDGATSSMDLVNPMQATEEDFALFIVAKSDRNANVPAGGSHWLSHRSNDGVYVAHTGYNYGRGYLAAHKTQGFLPNGAVNSSGIIYPQGFNVLEITSVNQIWNAIANGYLPLAGNRDIPNINAAEYKALFVNSPSKVAAEWWALGNMAEVFMINKTLTVNERARIRKFLDLKHGITSAYAGY